MYQFTFDNRRSGRFGGIGCLVFGVLFLVAAYYIFKGLYYVLLVAAPVLFVLALLINWRAVAGVGKSYLDLLGRSPLMGLLVGALAFVGFPFLALFLFLTALGGRRADAMRQEFEQRMGSGHTAPQDAEYVDFEEIESAPKPGEQPLPPPVLPEKEAPKKPTNPYEELF